MLAVLIRSAPYSTLEAAEGLRHLGGIETLGFSEGVGIFVDDGAYALRRDQHVPEERTSLEGAIRGLLDRGVKLLTDRESLDKRQLKRNDLIDGVEVADAATETLLQAGVVLIF